MLEVICRWIQIHGSFEGFFSIARWSIFTQLGSLEKLFGSVWKFYHRCIFWTRKSPLNFVSHLDPEWTRTWVCTVCCCLNLLSVIDLAACFECTLLPHITSIPPTLCGSPRALFVPWTDAVEICLFGSFLHVTIGHYHEGMTGDKYSSYRDIVRVCRLNLNNQHVATLHCSLTYF